MSIPGADLFHLIKSLTPSEKRYFKLFAQRQGNTRHKSYMKVFDLIDTQEETYDESILRKKLSKADEKMLPQVKVYLLENIVKSMRLFRSEKNVANEVFDLIQDELFFTDKGLLDLRIKSIKRAKELAYKYDLNYLLVAILNRERLISMRYGHADPATEIQRIHEEELAVIRRINDEAELGRIYAELWAQFIIDPLLHDQSLLERFNGFKEHRLLQRFEERETFLQKHYFIRCLHYISRFNNDRKAVYGYAQQMVKLFEEYPQHNYAVSGNYIDALSNLLGAAHSISTYDDFESVIAKLNGLSKEKTKDRISIESSVVHYRILYMLNTAKFDALEEVINDFHQLCRSFPKLIPASTIVLNNYNLCILMLMKDDLKRALSFCEQVFETPSDARKELRHGAMMLQLILHFELGNKLLLEGMIRSVVRSMQGEDRYGDFEKLFFAHLRKLIKSPEREIQQEFSSLFDDFIQLKRLTPGKIYVLMLETLAWAASHTENKPMLETLFRSYE